MLPMNEQLKDSIRREHPLLDKFVQMGKNDENGNKRWIAELEKLTSPIEDRITLELGGVVWWPFFAVPPIMRNGYRQEVFNREAPKEELYIVIRSLICIGYGIKDKVSLFRMDFLIALDWRGLTSDAVADDIFEGAIKHDVRKVEPVLCFVEEIAEQGRWLREAIENKFSPAQRFRLLRDSLN